jgi:ATP-binding cassette, subfamily B, bacterial
MIEGHALSLKHFLINLTRPYKGLFSIMALVGLTWAFTTTFTPYVLKLIIDHAVDFSGDKSDLFKTTQPYLFTYIGLWVILCINMRLLDWTKLKLFPIGDFLKNKPIAN